MSAILSNLNEDINEARQTLSGIHCNLCAGAYFHRLQVYMWHGAPLRTALQIAREEWATGTATDWFNLFLQ